MFSVKITTTPVTGASGIKRIIGVELMFESTVIWDLSASGGIVASVQEAIKSKYEFLRVYHAYPSDEESMITTASDITPRIEYPFPDFEGPDNGLPTIEWVELLEKLTVAANNALMNILNDVGYEVAK